MNTRPGVWVIIRAELRHEAKVYRRVVELGHDAWLPQMPRITRAHHTVKHRREWWKATMPTLFFAKADPFDTEHFHSIPYFRGIVSKRTGGFMVFDEDMLFSYRKRIDAENREILRIGAAIEPKIPPTKSTRPSKKISRQSTKPPKASVELASHVYRLIKAEQHPPCTSE